MTALSQRLAVLRRLLGHRISFAFVLFGLMLLAAVAELVGIGMVLPIVSTLAGISAGIGALGTYANAFLAWLPEGWRIELLVLILAVAFFCKGQLLVATHALTDYFALRLRDDWSVRMFEHYLTARYDTLVREKQGALIHNLTVEPYRAARGMELFLNLLNRLVMTVALAGALMIASWQATLGVAFAAALVFYPFRRWSYRYSLRFGRVHQELHQEVASLGAESIAAGIDIRLFGAVERVRKTLAKGLYKHTRAEALFRAMKELPTQNTEFLLILVLGATLIALTRVLGLQPSAYAAPLAFFVIVSQRLLTNFTFLMSQRMKLVSYLPSMRLVDQILNNEPVRERANDGATFTGLDGDIVFRGVTFAYERGRDVLRGLTLTVPRGRTTALIGPSGIGKSTVADLLLGLITPQAGTIRLGSRPHSDFSLASLRRAIGYVSQHPVIFNATVADNLRFGAPNASDEEITAAAQQARAHGFISKLPEGYATRIGDRGATLSGGERQRIAVARVILRRPSIYVFDEATSALDPESEALLRESIRALAADATVIIIAHRPSAVAGADVVYRLGADGARVVGLAEVGT